LFGFFPMDKEPLNTSPAHDHHRVSLSEVSGLDELIGQRDCVERLKRFGELYSVKNQVPEHMLLTGDHDLGTRTFAHAFAKTLNTDLLEYDAKEFERRGDLTAVLTSLEGREALLILNVQALRKATMEVLQVALNHYRIDLVIEAPRYRVHPFTLNRFTFLGTAPRATDVPPDLLKCFSLSLTLQPYSNSELQAIVVSLAARNGLTLSEGVLPLIVSVSQRTPSSIEQLLRRIARLGKTEVTEEDAIETSD